MRLLLQELQQMLGMSLMLYFVMGLKVSPLHYLRKYIEYIAVLVVTGGICYFLCSLCQFHIAINVVIKNYNMQCSSLISFSLSVIINQRKDSI